MKTVAKETTIPTPMIAAHTAMGSGFAKTAQTLVVMAVAKSMSRSMSNGKETTVREKTMVANTAPEMFPNSIK